MTGTPIPHIPRRDAVKPDVLDFGVLGLAAALESPSSEVLQLVHAGVICPEYVVNKEPRWSGHAILACIKQLLPAPRNQLDSLQRGLIAMQALERAYVAEYEQDLEGTHGHR
jgi:hypothetical protein